MIAIRDIEAQLLRRAPQFIEAPALTHAAVALLLREGGDGPEILFIERARHADDPWSGDLGFPGGKVETEDVDPRNAAERETLEEVGLDLAQGRLIGRLDDIVGAHLPVKVSCFVYVVPALTTFTLSEEVSDVFWLPLAIVSDPNRHLDAEVRFGGESFIRPAIRLPLDGKPVLWGITYRLVELFLSLVQANKGDKG
jgi:8-oxo-dGTP pyrophosphatase MutT (NUDIX family)